MNIEGKSFLITGGTGSFGGTVCNYLLKHKVKEIRIFSRDENKQYQMRRKIQDSRVSFCIGDIRDFNSIFESCDGINYIFHAAALKQVPAMEYNPSEAIKTNIYGAENIIRAAINNNVKRVIAISTDKAVTPVNLYGATKMCFEKLFLAANNLKGEKGPKFSVMRYGNVFGSRGSVVPLFLKQTQQKKFTITDKRMTRFTMTLTDAINFVLNCSEKMIGKEIFIPKLPSYNIVQLAKVINPEAEVEYIGIRPGEKIHESMISTHESENTLNCKNFFVILQNRIKLDKYIENYKNDFISMRQENEVYNSGNNLLISDSKLIELIRQYK